MKQKSLAERFWVDEKNKNEIGAWPETVKEKEWERKRHKAQIKIMKGGKLADKWLRWLRGVERLQNITTFTDCGNKCFYTRWSGKYHNRCDNSSSEKMPIIKWYYSEILYVFGLMPCSLIATTHHLSAAVL